jgi:hypothetical protein
MEVEAIRKILQEHKEVLSDVIASLLEENPAIIAKAIEKRPDIFSHILQPVKKDLDNIYYDLSQKMAKKDDLSLVIQTTKDDLKMVTEIIKAYQESTDKRFQQIIEKMATKIFSSRTDFPKFPFGAGDSASKVPDNMIKKQYNIS